MARVDNIIYLNAINKAGDATRLPVRFVEMTDVHIDVWEKKVQPDIRSFYEKLSKEVAKAELKVDEEALNRSPSTTQAVQAKVDSVKNAPNPAQVKKIRYRADVDWSWSDNFDYHEINNWLAERNRRVDKSRAVCLVAKKNGNDVPIGMLTLVPTFVCTVFGLKKKRAFTWYLSDAPREFYRRVLEMDEIQNIARALLDYTVQSGIEVNQEATLVLHADIYGGARLRKYYRDCGLTPIPAGLNPISPGRFFSTRKGYFKLKPEKSGEFIKFFDVHRASQYAGSSPELV
ncbi:hypothetical protein ACLUS7_01115 [Enterobacterales bacterium BD_CKDN230030183-1A_HGKHYDSX7]